MSHDYRTVPQWARHHGSSFHFTQGLDTVLTQAIEQRPAGSISENLFIDLHGAPLDGKCIRTGRAWRSPEIELLRKAGLARETRSWEKQAGPNCEIYGISLVERLDVPTKVGTPLRGSVFIRDQVEAMQFALDGYQSRGNEPGRMAFWVDGSHNEVSSSDTAVGYKEKHGLPSSK